MQTAVSDGHFLDALQNGGAKVFHGSGGMIPLRAA
jgi:hypothetical protein